MKITSIKEVYHELGDFEIRASIEDGVLATMLDQSFEMIDSSGKRLKTNSRMWGNKMKCFFTIDETVSDGVMSARLSVETSYGPVSLVAYCWCIK